MPKGLKSDFFSLFDLQPGFEIDQDTLKASFRDLQRLYHPDRYVNADDCEKRASVQMAARVNEGFETLRQPLKRARYLLVLNGREDNSETVTATDGAFLMAQMAYREEIEALESAASSESLDAIDPLRKRIRRDMASLYEEFSGKLSQSELDAAAASVQKLQFFQKLIASLDALEARLEDDLL